MTPSTLDGLPRRLQMPPPSNYQRANQHPVDAPVAQDLFGEGGYDEFDGANPPTDEFPAQVMEDVGQPYTTPFSVPDAPPIPGILDRFTPPPAHRTEIGSRRKKPDYLAETPHAKDRYQPTPSPVRRKTTPRSGDQARPVKVSPTDPIDRDDEPAGMPPLALWIGVGGVLFFLVGVVSLVVALIVVVMSSRTSEVDPAEREPVSGGVEIRQNMTEPPGLIGDPDELDGAEEVPAPAPDAPDPDPKSKVPAVVPEAPRPAAPAPQPAEAATPVVNKGLLKIRSNRRVLVYVDNRAIGYTPQDVPVEAGKHRVTAKIPGQPNSEQGRDAVMTEKKMDILVEFSF